jgi:hypothetical protein
MAVAYAETYTGNRKYHHRTQPTDDELLFFIIKEGLKVSSFPRYLGENLPEDRHSTLGNSTFNGKRLDRLLQEERDDVEEIFKSICKTCRVKNTN